MKLKNLLFTFIALAFSTLAMAQEYDHDVINLSWILSNGEDFGEEAYAFNGASSNTDATYSAYVAHDNGAMQFYTGYHGISVNQAAGYIRVLTINWNENTSSESILKVYGHKTQVVKSDDEGDSFFATIENPTGTLLGTITPSKTQFSISANYQYITIVGENNATVNSIDFAWQYIAEYAITPVFASSIQGTITVASSALSGSTVSVSFKSKNAPKAELTSYVIYKTGDPSTIIKQDSISEAKQTTNAITTSFQMPSYPVTVSARFQSRPLRDENKATVTSSQENIINDATKTITLISGKEYNFAVALDYASTGLSIDVASANTAKISNKNYNVASHSGTFTLTAYNQGNSDITFTAVQSKSKSATKTTYHINVIPRTIMLVAEYNGSYYAAVNTIGERLEAQEVMMNGETVVIAPTGTYSESQLLWKVCSKNPDYTEDNNPEFTIQNMNGEYLNVNTSGIAEFKKNGSHTWFKNSNRFHYTGKGIVYYANDGNFASLSLFDYAFGAKEYENYATATEETLRSNLTPDAFSTVCMPYSFIAGAGVTLYNIDDIETRADGRHIYFCPLEDGEETEAGRPYIIKCESNTAKGLKIGNENASAQFVNGLYGVMNNTYWYNLWETSVGDNTFENGNVMIFKNGTLTHVTFDTSKGQVGGGIAKNSACILISGIPTETSCTETTPSGAPRRVSAVVENNEVATAVENTLNATNINWNEPVYNIMGQRVARGTTGVLIQNGKKFIAE